MAKAGSAASKARVAKLNSSKSSSAVAAKASELSSVVKTAKSLGIDTGKADSMLKQTAAEGSNAYAGSSFEKDYEAGIAADPNASPQDKALQGLANVNPEAADTAMDALGYTNSPNQGDQVSYEQATQNLQAGGLQGSALANAQGQLDNKYQRAFQSLKSGGAAPSDPGLARMGVSNAITSQGPQGDQAVVDQVFSEDPVIQGIMSQAWDLLGSDNQKTSLMQDYKKLSKSLGIDEINEELIDAQTVLDGTEDDIRNEIQTAGGFGTESQVQAMTLARNKGLLKRYNTLFAQKTNAEQQLNTLMNLNAQDRQMAQQRVSNQLNTMFQFANFRSQSQNAIRETFNSLVARVGYKGAYQAYASNPQQLASIERVMGLGSGGLSNLAAQPDYDLMEKEASYRGQLLSNQKTSLEIQSLTDTSKQDRKVLQQADKAQTVSTSVDNAIKRITQGTTGLLGGLTQFVPGSESYKLAKDISTVKANIGFDELQRMRENSPTGGALGQVAVQELEGLQATLGSLDVGQDAETLKTNLGRVQEHYLKWLGVSDIGSLNRMGYTLTPDYELVKITQ